MSSLIQNYCLDIDILPIKTKGNKFRRLLSLGCSRRGTMETYLKVPARDQNTSLLYSSSAISLNKYRLVYATHTPNA